MFLVRKSHSTTALVVLAVSLLVTACTVDKSYDINPKDIDLTVTLLEDGLTVPIGSSEKISLGDLINSAGEGVNDFIKTGGNGELILSYDGSTSLNDQLAELDLKNMAVIDGVDFSSSFTHKLGDLDADKFKIEGKDYPLTVEFEGMDVLDVKTQPVSVSADNLTFNAGLDKLKDVMNNNEDLNLSSKIGNVSYNQNVLERDKVTNYVTLSPTETIDIPKDVIDKVSLPENTKVAVEVAGITLHNDVNKVSNLKTDPNARMVVEISLSNVFLTAGYAAPDVTLDFTKLFKIAGGSAVNIKGDEWKLNAANGWKASKSFVVEGLATTEYEGAIQLSESVGVAGDINLEGLQTTKTQFNATNGDIKLDIKVSFKDLKIVSADLGVNVDAFEKTDNISMGNFEETKLPNGIEDVKAIYMDESKPLTLKITPKNLSVLKQANLEYAFTLNFPASIKVKDAVGGKLEFSGDLANGAVEKQIVLQEIKPTVAGGKLTIDADVAVNAKVTPSGVVVDSSKLPSSKDEDLSFAVSVEGTPTISDFQIVLGNYEESIEISDVLEIDAEGLEDYSGIRIKPEGNPVLSIDCDIPTIKGLSLKPGAEGFKVVLPSFMVFNGSAIPAEYNFNSSDNSITLKSSFPKTINLPVKELYIQPMIVDGKAKVVGNYSAKGGVSIPSAEVSQAELKETFGSKIGLTIKVPEIKAASISLDKDVSVDVNQKYTINVKNIPEQLTRIDEVLLDDVYVNLEASFGGLPSSSVAVDLTVTLPEFISPNVIPVKGNIVDGKLKATPVKLEKLYNIEPGTYKDAEGVEFLGLQGDIVIAGNISLGGSNIDLSQLKSEISADIKASIQNKDGKIAISKASGVFSYDLEEETSIDLDTLPDALKGDNLGLDFADPQLNLDITTNLGIPMSATLEIIPFVNGAEIEANKVVLSNIALPYSEKPASTSTQKITICKTAASAPAGRTFVEGDINKLLKQIPDKLTIKIKASVDGNKTAVLEPAATYTLDIAYGINVPLTFGKDFFFTTDTELDLSGAASVIGMGDFGIKGKVVNDSPLNLAVEMELMEPDGNKIAQTAGKSSTINIAGASTSNVEFYLSPADKSKTVQKAKLTVKVSAIPNVPVKESDCLQFLDMVAVAAGGITVNPSK